MCIICHICNLNYSVQSTRDCPKIHVLAHKEHRFNLMFDFPFLTVYNSNSDFADVIVAVTGVTNWSGLGLALKLTPPVMRDIEKTH